MQEKDWAEETDRQTGGRKVVEIKHLGHHRESTFPGFLSPKERKHREKKESKAPRPSMAETVDQTDRQVDGKRKRTSAVIAGMAETVDQELVGSSTTIHVTPISSVQVPTR